MKLMSAFNADVFVAVTIVLPLLQSFVTSQAEVRAKSCPALRKRASALGAFRLEEIGQLNMK